MSINCKGELIDLMAPKVMGILNLTPDSFYDGGKYYSEEKIQERITQIVTEGADFIDIGGFSSRPGAEMISPEKELKRIAPAMKVLKKKYPNFPVSIDSYRKEVIEKLNQEYGVDLINDITAGGGDSELAQYAGENSIPYIIMHMQGLPENMQANPKYKDVVTELLTFFDKKIVQLKNLGLNDIIIDPGFGFGKSLDHNYQILASLEVLRCLEVPVLVGLSRKSMIYNFLDSKPDSALNGTSALNMYALNKGAGILRVHDVKEAKEVVCLYNKLYDLEKMN